MGLTHTLTGWICGKDKPIAISEAEIREELEFHLEMRSLDNQAAGMSFEDAQRDAKKRFGNFERQYEACRRITLGLPLALRRLQRILFVGLVGGRSIPGAGIGASSKRPHEIRGAAARFAQSTRGIPTTPASDTE